MDSETVRAAIAQLTIDGATVSLRTVQRITGGS
jgi:hypothetical protein